MTLRAIVLAAGASRRLGEPKALAKIAGRSALAHLLAALSEVDPCPLVVVGAHAAEIRARVSAPCQWVHNEDWPAGRTASLAAALPYAHGCDVLVAPVDVPLVAPTTVAELVAAWRRAGEPAGGWLAPRYGPTGAHGHPVIVGRELLRSLDTRKSLRAVRATAVPLLEWSSTDIAILDDLDTPEDLAQLRDRLGAKTEVSSQLQSIQPARNHEFSG